VSDNGVKRQVNEEGEELVVFTPKDIPICKHHNAKEWTQGEYINNQDGTVSCPNCPWGCRLPGYMRCHESRIVDLRILG
jgi:hypothetical protein